jgi:hypothetical protein
MQAVPVTSKYGMRVGPNGGAAAVERVPLAPPDKPVNEAAAEKLMSPGMMLLHAGQAADAAAANHPAAPPTAPTASPAPTKALTMSSILFDMRARAVELRAKIADADAARVELAQLEKMLEATTEAKS